MTKGTLLALLCIRALSPGARAAESPGVTAAPVLQIPLGARAVGMGGAYTALAGDVAALYYNPAGLSQAGAGELSLQYIRGFEDQRMETLAALAPLRGNGFFGHGSAAAGASLLLSQNGSIEVNRTRSDGSFLDSRTLDAGGDLVASLGYAESLGETPVRWVGRDYAVRHAAGASGKFIRSTLAEAYSATALALDMGYLAECPELGVSGGASILNLGTRMRFIEEGDPLPLTLRAGMAYRRSLKGMGAVLDHALTLAADAQYLSYEKQWHAVLGTEYLAQGSYALRLGYQFRRDLLGLTLGFGAKVRNIWLDYAWSMTEALSDAHRFTFTYRFGEGGRRRREAPSAEREPIFLREKPSPARNAPAETPGREEKKPAWVIR